MGIIRSVRTGELVSTWGLKLPPPATVMDQATQFVIHEENGKWVLYSHDGSKKLGTHDSKEAAEAQERAIQANKHAMTDDQHEIEIFATGTHAGIDFGVPQLDAMVANFERLAAHVKPPVKLGHSDNQILAGQADGDPALGWVTGLRRQGDKLLARVAAIPTVLREAIRSGLYKRVSSELYPAWEGTSWEKNLQTGVQGPVLSAIAFLGAQIPEVKNLQDLGALLHCESLRCVEPDTEAVRVLFACERLADAVLVAGLGTAPLVPDKTFDPVPPRRIPMADTPIPDEGADVSVRLAELEAKLAEAATQREKDRKAHEAEIATLKLAAERAQREAVAQRAVRFVEEHQREGRFQVSPAQAPFVTALYERLAGADLVITAEEAVERKLCAAEKPAAQTGLDLLIRLIEVAPDHAELFQTHSRATDGPAPVSTEEQVAIGLAEVAKEKGLDLEKYEDKQKAARILFKRRRDLAEAARVEA